MKTIHIPVSPGELLDKITILRIKVSRMTDPARLRNVQIELDELERVWRETGIIDAGVEAESLSLQHVNEQLWDIEDRIREKEAAGCFDDGFVQLARSVYMRNDERAAIKRRINVALGSRLIEEKSYASYAPSSTEPPAHRDGPLR